MWASLISVNRVNNMTSAPIVVVTGANRGIGFEISRQLASRGAQVVLTARKPGAGKAAVKKLAAQNLTVLFQPLNVTSRKSIAALREFLKRTFGRINVLINNAGIIANGDAPGLEVDMETLGRDRSGPRSAEPSSSLRTSSRYRAHRFRNPP
jgi:NAD(P)-dependent dehydrogenase (short-subunit alcohol dehydrogenase family)